VSKEVYLNYHDEVVTSLDDRRDLKVIKIRKAIESDIHDLVDLDNKCFDTYYYEKTKFSESDFQTYFYRRKSLILVAVRCSCVVGYVAGTLRTSRFRSIAHLDSIAVLSTERNKGIGSRLLALFIQGAKQHTCSIVLLEVAEANKKGFHFFFQRGFHKIGDLSEYYGKDLNGVLMELRV
jgi:ribosomal protein S18 acetylase RimI-like enzyme